MDDVRLRRLERSNRMLWAALAGCALVAAVAGARHEAPGMVQAREFRVVDDTGRARASFGIQAAGTLLTIEDDERHRVVRIGVDPEGSGAVAVVGSHGRAATLLVDRHDAQPKVVVSGRGGRALVDLPD